MPMNKTILLEKPFYQPMYRIQSASRVAVCSPYAKPAGLFRDTEPAWEEFDEHSLAGYFANGLRLAKANISKLENLSGVYSAHDAQELGFMMESLLHARQLLDEISSKGNAL